MLRGKALPLGLSVALAGMGAWIYFYEIEGQEARLEAEQRKERVFQQDIDEINKLDIRNEAGSFEFVRNGQDWMITSPQNLKADHALIQQLATEIPALLLDRKLTDAAARLDAFALQNPKMSLTIYHKGQGQTLHIGGPAPFNGQYYARLDESADVLLLSEPLQNFLDQDLSGYRNKSAIHFMVPHVNALTLTGKDRPDIYAKRIENTWFAAGGGVDFRLEQRAVEEFLLKIKQLSAERFFDDPKTALEGLPEPFATATLGFESGDVESATLHFYHSDSNPESELLTYLEGNQEPVVVNSEILESLGFTIDHLRDRTPVPFARWSVDNIEVEVGETKLLATRSEFEWSVAEGQGWKAQDVTLFLDLLNTAESETFLEVVDTKDALYGFDTNSFKVQLTNTSASKVHTFMVSQGSDQKTYIKVEGDSTLFRLEARLYNDLIGIIQPLKVPAIP